MREQEWKLGSELSDESKRYVLAAFCHRFTGQHRPAWAKEEWKDGKPYPLQFKDDADWLAHTRFPVTKAGEVDQRAGYCESTPTWPDNPELRRA